MTSSMLSRSTPTSLVSKEDEVRLEDLFVKNENNECDPSHQDCYPTESSFAGNQQNVSEDQIVASEKDITEHFYQVETLTCLWILFALIVIGNGTVLIALTMSKGRKSRMNFFIKNLALADLLVGLVSLLTDIIWKTTISWMAGEVMCKLIRYLQTVVTYASTYVLVALSIDRYDAITNPMNFSGSWRRARVLVVVAWILSFLFSTPIIFLYKIKETETYGDQCWIELGAPWTWMVFMTIASLTVFIIPAIIIAVCYIAIVCTIWNKGKETALMPAANGNNNGNATVTTSGGQVIEVKRKTSKNNNDNGSNGHAMVGAKPSGGKSDEDIETRRASSRGLIPKAKVKTVKMTFVIIFVFILCWSPYIIHDLLQVYGAIPTFGASKGIQAAVATLIQSLSSLNSAANPLIYCLFSTNIGATIYNLLKCRKQPVTMRTGMTTTTNYSKPSANSTVSLLGSAGGGQANNRQKQNDMNFHQQYSKPLLESSESIHPEKFESNNIENTKRQVIN